MLHSELIPAKEVESRRLMVMLHGLGDSLEGYRWLPEAMGLPWLNYLLANAPDDYYGGYSWFDFSSTRKGRTGFPPKKRSWAVFPKAA
jgi:phospholipase/carboxylesterase